MAEEIKSFRDQAIEAIQNHGSVRVGDTLYTLTGNPETGAKSIKDLPGEEVFAEGNSEATAAAMEKMKKEMAELQKRHDALLAAKKADVSAPAKTEAKKEE